MLKIDLASYQLATIKQKALQWASQFSYCCYLDNNQYTSYHYQTYACIIAVGQHKVLQCNAGNGFEQVKQLWEKERSWLFGYLGYDLKNEIENLQSNNPDHLAFPELCFFQPEYIIQLDIDISITSFGTLSEKEVWKKIELESVAEAKVNPTVNFRSRYTKKEFVSTIEKVKEHIARGDVYELNLCQEYFAEAAAIHPVDTFNALNKIAKAPFSAFLRIEDKYLLSASPERFLKKIGPQLISQPIKGTAKKGSNEAEDIQLKEQLRKDPKEQAENVMIVDLVRNDLGRSCKAGTVHVEELFGVYGFEQVNQLISTVVGELRTDIHFMDAIKNAFPMGSMTGAPKVRAMQLIEDYERSKRGLYSGAVGYITPEGDFDFNVVIRSLLYNETRQYLSYQVGGAITFNSIPEKEYEECLLKAKGLNQLFENNSSLAK